MKVVLRVKKSVTVASLMASRQIPLEKCIIDFFRFSRLIWIHVKVHSILVMVTNISVYVPSFIILRLIALEL